MNEKITEDYVKERIVDFLVNKKDGNWHIDKSIVNGLHEHGSDIIMYGGKRCSERFIIECKGKSYAKSAKSINKEGWLNALGQLITRMDVSRLTGSGDAKTINRAYKYALGLCEVSAKVALRRIPYNIAKVLNLYIFSVDDEGNVIQYSPKDFKYEC